MAEQHLRSPAWSDAQLPAAVAAATSWRGVMRELGLDPANGGVTRTIRRHAALLGLDTSRFRGNRSWSDAVLRQAVIESSTWEQVLAALGLSTQAGGERTLVKAHAARLGLDVSHLGQPPLRAGNSYQLEPGLARLRRAAESLAAAWFALCGRNVAFPVEPDAYDLLVDMPDGMKRVQVKTTTFKSKDGWLAQIGRRPYSTGNNAPLVPYDPEIIDLFFIIDGDLVMYLIPSHVIGGRVQILLRTYTQFIVASAASLMTSQVPDAPPPPGCVIPVRRESYDVPGIVPGPRSL
jgi:hypothetical protein